MRRLVAIMLAVVAFGVVLGACGDDTDSSATRSEVLTNLAKNVVAPGYEELDRTTADLATAVDAFCSSPNADRLKRAQDAWEGAWRAWNRTRAFRFGPLTDTRANADIAFMANSTKIDALVAGSDPAVGPPFTMAKVAELGADVRGLVAVEHLLFDQPVSAAGCSYATATANLAAEAAHTVATTWKDGADGELPFVRHLANPGSGKYKNDQAAVEDLVNGLSMALVESTRELADAEAAPPDERDTIGRHGGSMIRDNLWSVRALYFGSTTGGKGAGVDDLVAAVSSTSVERVGDFVERAARATDELPVALADAPAPQLRRAYQAARNAGTIIRAEVASELGVTLSLSDSDGDS